MPDTATVLSLVRASRPRMLRLQRRELHRFLVCYFASRALRPSPHLRALLIAGIDVYPGPFPVERSRLEAHLDAVVRVRETAVECAAPAAGVR